MSRALLTGLAALSLGCVSEQTIARDLVNAARPSRLPLVVACWEKEFEAAGFQGEHTATVSFEVESGTSKIRAAKVTSMEPSRDAPERDLAPFKACIEDALNRSALPTGADSNGPGFKASSDLAVRNYRIQFTDPSAEDRKRASARQAHVLLGPRADRCQGLFTYDPPRDASTLYNEIAASKSRAFQTKGQDPALYARELQKGYDTMLELRAQMIAELADPAIPDANKKRTQQVLSSLEESARNAGAKIGCSLPPRAR
ncbi:MAG TPA: hypothetical protein VK459_25045 [Polyangiaceae bacterium]|nr:hypothetical protein [Polyangiaceae bacterium]